MHIYIISGSKEKIIQVEEGQTILEAFQKNGFTDLHAPCGGRGSCGKCTVELEGRGDVLACMTTVRDGMRVTVDKILDGKDCVIAEEGSCYHYRTDGEAALLAACDIGTTTVVCHLIDGKTGKKLATFSELSAQRSFGADVLSRIQTASAGKLLLLHEQITAQISRMLGEMIQKVKAGNRIERLAVSGNTVMCHLLAGISPASIGVTPFQPEEYFGNELRGEKIGIPICETIYIAPAVAGYVGGDITCDMLAVMPERETRETLVLDVGTNGEMVLGHTGSYVCCATAVGSAFEGAELTMGMPAAKGAISHVWLDARRIRVEVIGGGQAEGICGSGLIDALSVLLQMGLLDHTGLLKQSDAVSVAYWKYLGTYRGQTCVWLTPEVCLTQEDIRDLQLAKAAFAAGIQIMLKERKIACEQIERVVLAGGFGSYLDKESAAKIGLIPQCLLNVTESVGNAAGEGAVSAAISAAARNKLAELKNSMHYIELSTHPDFPECYMEQMEFR